ncbi:alpha/beta hydrolase family protein [Mariniplasma anaerobium]|uniref:Carboxylic ester hydrolase n=1 Tax=Mariniplasma anaerobium TaxID=2735436 RepID=A0A7U9TGK4_9MOLU|nr:hypothetical protein [Mariniplasma anaerobium]BCR35745.1 carboxylic ester hydrolase [Mariniplasma anaerobium]
MILLEVFIYVSSLSLIISLMIKKPIKPIYVIFLWGTSVLAIVLHLILQGSRWQFYLLYLALLLIGVLIYFSLIMNTTLKTFIRRTLMIISSVFIVISAISILVFPMYDLPIPSGNYLIGTESFVIDDQARLELYSQDPNDFRRTKIQIWYPADTIDGYEQAPWLEDGLVVARALSKDTGLPDFVLDHTVNILSNSYFNAPISTDLENYPIVILSHGWRGFRNLHTDYAEELASQGYIVVGIDHSYGSVATLFDDDDVAYLNLDALPDRQTTNDFIEYANQLVYTYASDITATLDYLEDINDIDSQSRFSGKLDLDKIGLLGHSTGGGADVAVALDDDRIAAVIGLDAWVESINENRINVGLDIPSMFLRSGSWETGENNANLLSLIEQSTYPSILYQIDGTTHYDFAMVYMYSPLVKTIGFSGSVESRYLVTILKSMITDFFDEALKDDANSQIDPNQWEEVRIINS